MKMGPQDTVWITGAAGRMGQAIEHFLDHSRYKVMTSDIEIDVSNLHEVLNFAESYRPDFVINCAALASRTEADENPDKAYKVNALGARNLAIASNNVGATMVHLSTDDLFPENADHAFNEFDTTNPPHVYGKSKQAGERFVNELTSSCAPAGSTPPAPTTCSAARCWQAPRAKRCPCPRTSSPALRRWTRSPSSLSPPWSPTSSARSMPPARA